MNPKKLQHLFAAARREAPPSPPADFAGDVLRAIHNSPSAAVPSAPAPSLSLADQLNPLFPRIALAALAVIALGIAADYGLSAAGGPDLTDGMAQISAQWFVTPGGL